MSKHKEYFVVGDIHGNLEALLALLENWDSEKQQLIFLGDLVSRGPNSLAVIQLVMNLVKDYNAICLLGNHELMFDEFLYEHTIYKGYLSPYVGGMDTLGSFIYDLLSKGYKEDFLGDMKNLVETIEKEYPKELEFVRNRNKYYLTDRFIFVHASIENDAERINDMTLNSILWGNKEFYTEPHLFDRIVVFGHYTTQNLGAKGGLYISACKRKIGVDGGGFLKTQEASINACILSDNPRKKKIVNYRFYTNSKELDVELYSL